MTPPRFVHIPDNELELIKQRLKDHQESRYCDNGLVQSCCMFTLIEHVDNRLLYLVRHEMQVRDEMRDVVNNDELYSALVWKSYA